MFVAILCGCVYFVYTVATQPAKHLGTIVYFALVIAGTHLWVYYTYRKQSKRFGLQAEQATLAALDRCGLCNYPLEQINVADDGCRQCPECGAAWHTDRSVFRNLDTHARALVRRRWEKHGNFVTGACDDRGVFLPGPIQWPPTSSQYTLARDHPVRKQLESIQRRRRWILVLLLLLVCCAYAAMMFVGMGSATMTLILMVLPVVLFGVLFFAFNRHLLKEAETRRAFKSHLMCPCCYAPLSNLPAQFDGCVVCPACRGAWRTTGPSGMAL